MDILAVQRRLLDMGFQFVEHVFNDGNPRNCIIRVTSSKNPHYFQSYPLGDAGWGRFARMEAWMHVAEWLDAIECGEKEKPPEGPIPRPK